jgi:hypothetical protein
LVSKFAHDSDSRKRFSLNNPKFARLGPQALKDIKLAWKESIDGLVKERLGVTIEQSRRYGPVCLVMPDGARLEALNRDSRRLLDIALRPMVSSTDKKGNARAPRPFELKVMDDRIFEVAAGMKGAAGWNSAEFERLFPKEARFVGRYDRRVESLKRVGYLTSEGQITPAFRMHYAARKGPLLPELQALRIEIARELERMPEPGAGKRPKQEQVVAQYRKALGRLGYLGVPVPSAGEPAGNGATKPERDSAKGSSRPDPGAQLWGAVDRLDHLRRRLERLGLTPADVGMVFSAAAGSRPTPENLARLRAARDGRRTRRSPGFARLLGGFVSVPVDQETRDMEKLGNLLGGGLFSAFASRAASTSYPHRPMVHAASVTKKIARNPSRLRAALHHFLPVAQVDARRLLVLPQLAAQVKGAGRQLDRSIPPEAALVLARGLEVLEQLKPGRLRPLGEWSKDPQRLTDAVIRQARGTGNELTLPQYEIAVQAGRIGRALERASETQAGRPQPDRASLEPVALETKTLRSRLDALGLRLSFSEQDVTPENRKTVATILATFRNHGLLDGGPGWTVERPKFQRVLEATAAMRAEVWAERNPPEKDR